MLIFTPLEPSSRRKVLLVCAHRPGRSPSQRYRFEQYIPLLEKHGFEFTFAPLLSAGQDRVFYSKGRILQKAFILLNCFIKRNRDKSKLKDASIVLIQREALFTGSTLFERAAAASGAYVIFDFDDSIWIEDTSPGNKRWAWLKRPQKFFENVRFANKVIAGNEYLASKALPHNPDTTVIPTTVDTDIHIPMHSLRGGGAVTIGWSGSISTGKHFELILPVLMRLKEEFGERLHFKIMGTHTTYPELRGLETVPWTEQTEVPVLNSFDIGVMPLPDDEWSRGKCGLKALTYMACEVPVVATPLGVNTSIITHGENGMLAATAEQWYNCLLQLVNDGAMRNRMGRLGRKTVEEKYSVKANFPAYLGVFEKAAVHFS